MPNAIMTSVAIVVALSSADAAEARKFETKGVTRTVTACSAYGRHGCVTAPVRMTSLGPQFRSPGGNGTWCEHDCRDTLRRATVDFWDDQNERSK